MYKDRSAIIKKVPIHTAIVMTCIIASVIISDDHKALATIISVLLCGIWFICAHKYKKRHPNDVPPLMKRVAIGVVSREKRLSQNSNINK